MLPATAAGIKVLGVHRWEKLLSKTPAASVPTTNVSNATNHSSEADIKRAREVGRLVRAAANHGVYRANCLEQSLVLRWLLARNGLESELRFGAHKVKDELQAHAWVECHGVALNENRGVEERYSPFIGSRQSLRVGPR